MFTENQVRQFYVAATTAAPKIDAATTVVATDNPGKMEFVAKGDSAYFMYSGAIVGDLQRSDLMKKCNVMDVRLTDAKDLSHPIKKFKVALSSSVNSGAPVVGEDYVLTINIENYIAPGNDSTKSKFGAAHAFTTTASDLYKTLAISLAKNFAREPAKLIKITLDGDSNNTEIKRNTKPADLSSITATGIVIEEVEQPWRRGAAQQEFVNFNVVPSTIFFGGADVVWGEVEDVTVYDKSDNDYVFIPNSKHVADMEWFFHKERGDKYGEMCWPWNIDTIYQVDPANADGYSFVDIHFYYEGNSHNIGHSEKTITIVGTKANLKTLIGSEATTGTNATAATGLFAWLEGSNANIRKSENW